MNLNRFKYFSVIIPVYNGEKFISACLQSLYDQNYPGDNFEIIVVDNNSNDKSIELIDKDRVVVLTENKKGSYAARNKGIEAARGEILAFTDVDCVVSKNWLEEANRFFLNSDKQIVSGAIEFIANNDLNIWGHYDYNRFLKQEIYYQRKGAATANLFAYREVFKQVGYFDADLQSGGDVTWVNRAYKSGVVFGYRNALKVFHPVRNSYREVAEKCFRVGYGKGQLAGKNNERFYLLNPKHLSPGIGTLKRLIGKPVYGLFYVIRMLFVIYFLNCLEYKGKVNGYFTEIKRK